MPKALTDWFASRYAAPTNVQEIAWRRTLRGDNTLILAPTGSGKTLAAFFSVLAGWAPRRPAVRCRTRRWPSM